MSSEPGSRPGGLVLVLRVIVAATAALAGCADPAWSPTGAMIEGRAFHTATPLDDGNILLAGGENGDALASAERYDPRRHTWSRAAPMLEARAWHAATPIMGETSQGRARVLVAGGDRGGALASAALYDPGTDTWVEAAPMMEARKAPMATRLLEGQVLVLGGDNGGALASAELFDPAADPMAAWSSAGTMAQARRGATATLLLHGKDTREKVLVVGGDDGQTTIAAAELFDPAAAADAAWSPAGSMNTPRSGHTATTLRNGQVLCAGGHDGQSALSSAELYDPVTDTWTVVAAAMTTARSLATATLLRNGEVLIVGGLAGAGAGDESASAELYDPRTGAWSVVDPLTEARAGHTATLIADGEVLIAGGDSDGARGSAELYRPRSQCETLDDCPASLVCNADKECEPPRSEALTGACAAAPGGARAGVSAGPSMGGAALLLLGAGALLAARRRRKARWIGPLVLLPLLLAPARARAQATTFYLDRLQVAGAPEDGQGIWRPEIGPNRVYGQLALGYSANPLRVENVVDDADRVLGLLDSPVKRQITTYFTLGSEILDRAAVQVSFPLTVFQDGSPTDNASTGVPDAVSLETTAPGDLRLDGRVVLLATESRSFKLGVRAAVFLPIGDERSFTGDIGTWGNVGLAAEVDLDAIVFTLNTGVSIRSKTTLNDLTVGSELTYGLAAYLPLLQGRVRLGIEVLGSTGIVPETAGDIDTSPLEWSLNPRLFLDAKRTVWIALGAGTRLNDSAAPDFRGVALVGGALAFDDDDDAFMARLEEQPREAPDTDKDGMSDLVDGCPGEPEDGVHPEDGCPEPPDADSDGILGARDACPDRPEDIDKIDDADGCPEDDADGDGVADVADRCPKEPGLHGEIPETEGCPRFIRRLGTEVRLMKEIDFDFDDATIATRSYPILDEIVRFLRANPEITQLRIEGHTNNVGTAEYNLTLSRMRAAAVRNDLVKRGGIDPWRVISEGFGATRLLASNDTPEERRKNRRVEIHIITQSTPAP